MYTPESAARIARMKLSLRPTPDLIRDFILTGAIRDPHIPTVRGWIMEELERRNPDAYNAWLDAYDTDESLPKYFLC